VRLQNSDAARGKSGGYRVIYYVKSADQAVLITISSKTDYADISAAEIARIIGNDEP
jgi:mRNA-degrading endonuclease RelE of RelBE toxin-antitoxin system